VVAVDIFSNQFLIVIKLYENNQLNFELLSVHQK
jgi:hypothetical protein